MIKKFRQNFFQMAYTRQKYFEENEYYVRKYEVDRHGLSREQVEKERRTYGQPFESSLTSTYPSSRPTPIGRSILDSDLSRRYEYEDSSRINKSCSEFMRQKHFQQPNYLQPSVPATAVSTSFGHQPYSQPYIHPVKYYDAPVVHHHQVRPVVQQQPLFRQNNLVVQPVVQQTGSEVHPQQHPQQSAALQNNQEGSTTALYSPTRAGSPQTLTGAGDIENTEAGFSIHLNVEHFEPKDIRVTLSGNVLSVLGERIDQDKSHEQTLKRSFSRKYSIPEDIKTNSIKSFVSDSGTLVIKGSRKTWKETEIDIQIEPQESKNSGSLITSPKSTQHSPAGSSKSKSSVKSYSKSASTKQSDEE